MKPHSLYSLTVEIDDIDIEDHRQITVNATTADTDDRYSDNELWTAIETMAGIIGRVAGQAAPFIAQERITHRCSHRHATHKESDGPLDPPIIDGCSLSIPDTLLRPHRDTGDPPALWLIVPTRRVQHWLSLIKAWLAAITDDKATVWKDPPAPTVRAAPPLPPTRARPKASNPTPRPRWCGRCDKPTRQLEDPQTKLPSRCPNCHPTAAIRNTA